MTKLQIILAIIAASGVSYVSGLATAPQAVQFGSGMIDNAIDRNTGTTQQERLELVAKWKRIADAGAEAADVFAKKMGVEPPPVRMEYTPAPEPVMEPSPEPAPQADPVPAPLPRRMVYFWGKDCEPCQRMANDLSAYCKANHPDWKLGYTKACQIQWVNPTTELAASMGVKPGDPIPQFVFVEGDKVKMRGKGAHPAAAVVVELEKFLNQESR